MSAPVMVNVRLTIEQATALSDFAASMLDDVPNAIAVPIGESIGIIAAALVVANAEAAHNAARDEQRDEAERIAAASVPTKVRIKITRRLMFKSGHVMRIGELLDVERRMEARWDPKTDGWNAVVGYTVSSGNGYGYAVPATHAKEVAS